MALIEAREDGTGSEIVFKCRPQTAVRPPFAGGNDRYGFAGTPSIDERADRGCVAQAARDDDFGAEMFGGSDQRGTVRRRKNEPRAGW